MSTELKFEIVSNDLRESLPKIPRYTNNPILLKLLADETVFIAATEDEKLDEKLDKNLNKFYEKARRVGKKLNKRKTVVNDVTGFVMWLSDKETV